MRRKWTRKQKNSEKSRCVFLIMQLNSISVMDIVAYGGAAIGMILSVLELRAGAISLAQCFFIIMVSAEFFLPLRMLGSFFHIAMNGNEAANKIFCPVRQCRKRKKERRLPVMEIRFVFHT